MLQPGGESIGETPCMVAADKVQLAHNLRGHPECSSSGESVSELTGKLCGLQRVEVSPGHSCAGAGCPSLMST